MPSRSSSTHRYFSELQAIAKRRGGRLLSLVYLGDTTKLLFCCGEGHEWEASPGKIKQGHWCHACGRKKMGHEKRLRCEARLKRQVALLGGVVLSPSYVNNHTKLRYRCRQSHEWEAVPSSVLLGTWCPECGQDKRGMTRRRHMLDRAREIVRQRGGKLLTWEVESSHEPVLVRCKEGHEWSTPPSSLDDGVWCPMCKEDVWLEVVRAKAKEQGGRCLSERCRGWEDRVLLECAQGHRWNMAAVRVRRGTWCARCRACAPHDLAFMRQIARDREGECLSKRYVDSDTPLRWVCAEGHKWKAKPGTIVQGAWCRVCRRGWGRSRRALTIDIMHEMARERGGKCLSEHYSGIYSKLRWRCAAGHEWVTVANNVRRGGWCPQCSGAIHGTLERMHELAMLRGGRCLSRSWNDHRKALQFECGAGHRFLLRSTVIKTGVWCKQCRPARARR